jgi:hypothetical protein
MQTDSTTAHLLHLTLAIDCQSAGGGSSVLHTGQGIPGPPQSSCGQPCSGLLLADPAVVAEADLRRLRQVSRPRSTGIHAPHPSFGSMTKKWALRAPMPERLS